MTKMKTSGTATILGYIAVLFWALSGVLASSVKLIPTFEILSIAFAISFFFSIAYLTIKKRWHVIANQPLIIWILGIAGIWLNDYLYINAFKYAPAAQVDLINYLWPLLIVLFSQFLPEEKLSWRYVCSAIVGFGGVAVIIYGDPAQGMDPSYWKGYLLVFGDALIWSVYTLAARYYKQKPIELIGMYCGLGMLFSLGIHVRYEQFVAPENLQWFTLIWMGLTSQGSAYFLWDHGIKKGNYKLLTILSYGNPILSILLLILFGYTHSSTALYVSCILITLSIFLATEKKEKICVIQSQ